MVPEMLTSVLTFDWLLHSRYLQAQPVSPAASSAAAPGSPEEEAAAASSASRGGSLMKSLTKSVTSSFTGAFAPASRSRKSSAAGPAAAAAIGAAVGAAAGAAAAGSAAAASAPAAAGAAASPPGVGPLAEGLPAALPIAVPARSSMASVRSALSEDEGEGVRSASAAGSPLGPSPLGVLRSKSDGAALQQASMGAVSPSAGSEASQQSPERSLSPGPDRRRTSAGCSIPPSSPDGGVPHSKSTGALAPEQQAGAAEQSGEERADTCPVPVVVLRAPCKQPALCAPLPVAFGLMPHCCCPTPCRLVHGFVLPGQPPAPQRGVAVRPALLASRGGVGGRCARQPLPRPNAQVGVHGLCICKPGMLLGSSISVHFGPNP